MPFASQYERIQQRLYTEIATGPYHPISTDVETKLKSVDGDTSVEPASIHAEEMSTRFGDPRRNRRVARQERLGWRWSVSARFNQEVTTEAVERRLINRAIILPRDDANELEQVTLKLLEADPFHPPQQHPSAGTQVTFTFEAELSPA